MSKQKNINDNFSTEYEFYKIYAEKIVPILNDFEQKRKTDLIIYFITMAILVLTMIGICYLPWITFKCVAFLVFIIAVIFTHMIIYDNFRNNLKKVCLPKLLKAFGDIHWKEAKISDLEIEGSNLFSVYNDREDDDYFNGKYKGVEFKILETKFENVRKTSKGNIVWPVFKGVVITVSTNKNIKSKTIITSKGDFNIHNQDPLTMILVIIMLGLLLIQVIWWLFGIGFIYSHSNVFSENGFAGDFILSILKDYLNPVMLIPFVFIGFLVFLVLAGVIKKRNEEKLKNGHLCKINLESSNFNRKYEVSSADEIESRYLVTTAFMERFMNLHTAFGSQNAKCSFCGNKIMFAISTRKNLFEIGNLFFPVNNIKQVNILLKEISAIYKLIDYFKLNEKTGL